MNMSLKNRQRGYAAVPLLLAAVAAIAVATAMATSVIRPMMLSVASSRARAMSETAMSAAVTQLTAAPAFTTSNVALLPAYQGAAFAPTGGGQLPASLPNVARVDGWGNALGYCVASSAAVSDSAAALVSAGKDGVFQTPCSAALLGQSMGDDVVRVITSATLLKGRTGAIDHGKPVASVNVLNQLQYITPGEIRPVLDDGTGHASVYLNPTGTPGQWQPLQSQSQMSPLLKGLVSYWPVDEGGGFYARDAKSGHDISFSTQTTVPGVFGQARLGTGASYFQLPEVPASGSSQVTVAMWLDSASLTNYEMPFSFATYDIWYNKDLGLIGFNTYQGEIRGVPPATGKHLYVFVMDTRKNATDNFAPDERIYIDGVRQTLTLAGSQPLPANRAWSTGVDLGGTGNSAWNMANMFFDDMAVWSRALTDDEAYRLWQTGRSLGDQLTEGAGFVQRNGVWQPMAATPLASCLTYHNKGALSDGLYLVFPPGASSSLQVWCDMTSDGGGWELVMRGYGGSAVSSWNVTTAVNPAFATTPNAPYATTSFKLDDATINLLRAGGAGIYRTRSDGSYYNVTRFWQAGTYAHVAQPPASAAAGVSYANTSWTGSVAATSAWLNTGGYRGGLSDNNGSGSLYFGTNQMGAGSTYAGWALGFNVASAYCLGTSVGCNFTMWVR